jgi:hypothetical protein
VRVAEALLYLSIHNLTIAPLERNWLIALNAFIMASGLLLGAFAIYLTALVSYNSISSDGQVRLAIDLYTGKVVLVLMQYTCLLQLLLLCAGRNISINSV